MTALRSLQETNKMLAETQNRISTGYKVSDATDNAAYWSIATTMRSDNKALRTVEPQPRLSLSSDCSDALNENIMFYDGAHQFQLI